MHHSYLLIHRSSAVSRHHRSLTGPVVLTVSLLLESPSPKRVRIVTTYFLLRFWRMFENSPDTVTNPFPERFAASTVGRLYV